ncbi:sugar ABC transporter substrate-binding protein [Brevibacillus sp. SYP-B805]|uniref:sugar ABC transporter substrate-binding protein n=1 Tax=Brevibacillus sp. SYP-B805 TaxID=1578199 RepID=UPI0013EC2412|nr:sugar ABC transporter substrate-binding protein [Brevibacillus sp. SYP-B805]NGQ93581.1 sugar ABC transporter substrate-binding protein [Brevibacillus sp. SYP-B805]
MKKWVSLILVVIVLGLSACTNEQNSFPDPQKSSQETTSASANDGKTANGATGQNAGQASVQSADIPEKLKKPLNIALVTRITSGAFFAQYNQGVKDQVEAFGGKLKIYDSNNDLAKMASNVEAAINEKVDAILVNNGTAQALAPVVQKALAAGIQVVAYDSDLNLPGVTSIDQDDYLLAWQSLKKLATDLNGKGNIAVLWVAGYLPMERREVMIEAFQKRYPNIKIVSRFGSVTSNTALDTQAQVEALLKKYPEQGQLQAIYTTWNEFTRGVLPALEQAKRTDIKVYGIDLTEEDLPLFQKEGSPWVAASATNPTDIGQIHVRLVYQKVAGETVPDNVSIEPHLILQANLPKEKIAFSDLSKYVPGWGSSDAARSPWMDTLAKGVGK